MKLIIGEGRTILKGIAVELTKDNTRYVLLALREFEAKCYAIVHHEHATEDDIFFYGNDLLDTALVHNKTKEMAVNAFGKQILNCSHETLGGVVDAEMSLDTGDMKTITVELTHGNTSVLLHAIRELEVKYQHIIHGEHSAEEDRPFYTHDLMQIKLIHDKIRKMAMSTFGDTILNFSHETL